MKLDAEFTTQADLEAALEVIEPVYNPVLYSSKPVELGQGVLERPSRMSLVAVLTGVVTGVLVAAFVLWSQRDYPLVTGGMPINSLWPIGVIIYELTMLGSVAGVVGMFLIEGGFFSKEKGPIAALDSESYFLRVECEVDETEELIQKLRGIEASSIHREEAP